MSDDQTQGAIRKAVGHVQSGIGTLTGDERVHVKGKLNESAGSAQNALGKAKELVAQAQVQGKPVVADIERRLNNKPFTAIAIGVVLGWLLRGGPKKVYIRK